MGTLAIALTYYLGRLVYGRSGVGLAAAALLSCNVFHIQLSRFFTSDIPLTTLCLAAIISLVHLYRSGSLAWFIAFGFFAGLATATKISSVFLSVPLALALVLLELRQSDGTKSWKPYLVRAGSTLAVFVAFLAVWQVGLANGMTVFGSQVPKVALLIPLAAPMFVCVAALWWNYSKPIAYTALAFAVGVVIFMTAEPYAILDYNTFTQHTREQTSMVRGYWRPPYTIQYERTVPYFYHLKQMLWYTMGWPVFLGVAIGFMAALARSGASIVTLVFRSPFERRLREEIIPVTFVIVFFATTAGFQVKFPRYLMPLYPFLFVFTAALFSSVLEGIPAFERSKFSARGTERA
jgi:4-amino-4-deoxy-L-arabinose transferase-like glycosyltransferase